MSMKTRASGGWVVTIVTVAIASALGACGPTQSNAPPPRTGESAVGSADGGLPPPQRSSKQGVIVPSDTGVGTMPAGSGTATGTSHGTMDKSIGNAPGSGS